MGGSRAARAFLRRGPGSLYRSLKSLQFLATRDRRAVCDLLRADLPGISRARRLDLIRRFVRATNAVRGYHTLTEMLTLARAILARAGTSPLVLEAGCGFGASTAKLSLATRLASGSLIACDSFQGIPENEEEHELLDGRKVEFRAGAFRGRLTVVRRNVQAWGAPEVCRFERGWFRDVLPRVEGPFDIVVLDVDLEESTRTCLRELWPRLRPGGVLYSLDGQLVRTHRVFGDARFWREDVGCEPPEVEGLGRSKLLAAVKA
jgi:predicted O-methyltransferase YrrM